MASPQVVCISELCSTQDIVFATSAEVRSVLEEILAPGLISQPD